MNALAMAALRALPLAMCLPLPGLASRLALGLVLAMVGASAPSLASMSLARAPAELAIGLAIGLFVAVPVMAARYAGNLLDSSLAERDRMESFGPLCATLAWILFCATGGLSFLCEAYVASYAIVWSSGAGAIALADKGLVALALAAKLALPALLATAVLEISAGFVTRFESAGLELGSRRLARGLRPLVVLLLVVASLAAFSRGVEAATRSFAQMLHTRPSP